MTNVRLLIATIFLALPVWLRAAPNENPSTQPRLEHIAVWAKDLEKTSKFLTEALGWKRHPVQFGVDKDSSVFGGMTLAFVDANGFWLELVQPTTAGPGMDFLKEKGNGSLVELDFEVDDFDKNFAEMKARGIHLAGMDGKPLKNDGKLSDWILKGGQRVRNDESGGLLSEWVVRNGKRDYGDERLGYLPPDVSRGTSVEMFWEFPNGVVRDRDANWSNEMKTPRSAPRLDHVVLMAADIERTTQVYTDVLRLKRNSMTEGLSRDWMGVTDKSHAWIETNGSVWLDIVAPSGRAGSAVLKSKKLGDGALVELAVEVGDIEAFYDKMKAKGITMTAGDSRALPAGKKAVTQESSGDRYNYFPLGKSEGMRIMVYQRGPSETSIFNRRGDAPRK